MKDEIKTRKANRIIISVSLPLHLYDEMQELVDSYGLNRSVFIGTSVRRYIDDLNIMYDRPSVRGDTNESAKG